jgi:hypothetical protein
MATIADKAGALGSENVDYRTYIVKKKNTKQGFFVFLCIFLKGQGRRRKEDGASQGS